MAFLDEMDRKLTQLSRNAVQKTKEFTESARITGEIHELEQKIQNIYGEIGKIYVMELQPESIPTEYRELYNQLYTLQQQLEGLKQMQSAGGNFRSCPNCRAQIPVNSVFCNHCGADLRQGTNYMPAGQQFQNQSPKPQPYPMAAAVCTNCGAELKANQVFCINCGTKVDKAKPVKSEPAQKITEQQVEKDVKDVSDITELISGEENEEADSNVAKSICPACGAEIKGGQLFCINCGQKL